MKELSEIRQKIYQLNKERWGFVESILTSGNLLKASFYERHTKCSSPNCKCAHGELHGPFPWIYRNRKGEKLVSTSCNADKVDEAKRCSENYKIFKDTCKKIQNIDAEIASLMGKIEDILEVDTQIFTKKEGEKRGRKQAKS